MIFGLWSHWTIGLLNRMCQFFIKVINHIIVVFNFFAHFVVIFVLISSSLPFEISIQAINLKCVFPSRLSFSSLFGYSDCYFTKFPTREITRVSQACARVIPACARVIPACARVIPACTRMHTAGSRVRTRLHIAESRVQHAWNTQEFSIQIAPTRIGSTWSYQTYLLLFVTKRLLTCKYNPIDRCLRQNTHIISRILFKS